MKNDNITFTKLLLLKSKIIMKSKMAVGLLFSVNYSYERSQIWEIRKNV
jgi:hypothetical protein